jgi:hypothetical protein
MKSIILPGFSAELSVSKCTSEYKIASSLTLLGETDRVIPQLPRSVACRMAMAWHNSACDSGSMTQECYFAGELTDRICG